MLIFSTTIEETLINMDNQMPLVVQIIKNTEEQDFEKQSTEERLQTLGLTKEGLMLVARNSLSARNEAVINHPTNAPGTLTYIEGVRSLRDIFCGNDWAIYKPDNLELIHNEELGIKIGFQNVDIACNLDSPPIARSKKGFGSVRACIGNENHSLPLSSVMDMPLPQDVKIHDTSVLYYLMLAEDGAVELSCPTIKRGEFHLFVERIFIATADELENFKPERDTEISNDPNPSEEYEFEITPK